MNLACDHSLLVSIYCLKLLIRNISCEIITHLQCSYKSAILKLCPVSPALGSFILRFNSTVKYRTEGWTKRQLYCTVAKKHTRNQKPENRKLETNDEELKHWEARQLNWEQS